MNKNVLLGKSKQLIANVLHMYGALTKNKKVLARSQFLHCSGRVQQGQGIATVFAKRQLAAWDRKVG